jgi:ABC-type transporter Mla maintaining outer membrane lipid asymmetry ATPase subunit MlaF
MLYQGSLIAVGTKDEIRQNPHPRIRQFLDRVPDRLADSSAIQSHFKRYIEGDEL